MKPKIGIIGIKGKFGQFLSNFFKQQDYDVIGSDVMTDITNRQVVEQADVVIFSVPISRVVSVINDVAEFSREGQLFMDVTSIKGPAVDAMMLSKADVVGLHPMFAPTVNTFRGQVIVRCNARLTDKWKPWVEEILESTRAIIKKSTPEEHDKYMAFVQAFPHVIILIMVRVMCRQGIDVAESMSYASPFYKIVLGLIGRILSMLSKNFSMYASIQTENPHFPKVLEALEHECTRYRAIIEKKDKVFRAQALNDDCSSSVRHIGDTSIAIGNKSFEDIAGLMSDFSERNMFVLETETDHPGIAHEITGIFADAGVNLTSFHTQKTIESKVTFLVGFDKQKDSSAIKAVESKINEMLYVKIVS